MTRVLTGRTWTNGLVCIGDAWQLKKNNVKNHIIEVLLVRNNSIKKGILTNYLLKIKNKNK